MINRGTVIKSEGNYITVAVKRYSACDTCRAKCSGHCDKPTVINTVLENTLSAKVGDVVELFSKTSSVLTSAFIFFIAPIVMTVIGYLLPYALSLSKTISIVSATVFFFLSYLFIWLIYRNKKSSDNIKLIRIINE